jgi:hypothetical protein
MSFLEYVCQKLMGPAVRGGMWCCPYHPDKDPSFSVRPAKGDFPIKFACFGCGQWGDEFDLMRLYFPNENYPQHRVRLDKWRQDFEAEVPQKKSTDIDRHSNSSSRGSGRTVMNEEQNDVKMVWGYLSLLCKCHEDFVLELLTKIVDGCADYDVSAGAVLHRGIEVLTLERDMLRKNPRRRKMRDLIRRAIKASGGEQHKMLAISGELQKIRRREN